MADGRHLEKWKNETTIVAVIKMRVNDYGKCVREWRGKGSFN